MSPTSYPFTASLGNASSDNNTNDGGVLILNPSEPSVFTFTNSGLAGSTEGPLVVTLGGTNPSDFGIVSDGCTGKSLNSTNGLSCYVTVTFAPTVAGTRTATLTATSTADSQTVSATLTGTAGGPSAITPSPTGTTAAPLSLGTVALTGAGQWTTITLTNTGTSQSGLVTYTLDDTTNFTIFTPASSSAGYPGHSMRQYRCPASSTLPKTAPSRSASIRHRGLLAQFPRRH